MYLSFLNVFFSVCQLKNSLKSDLCLDQGPENDNVPILYLCHGMTPQVRALYLHSAVSCSAQHKDLIYQPYIVFTSQDFIFILKKNNVQIESNSVALYKNTPMC